MMFNLQLFGYKPLPTTTAAATITTKGATATTLGATATTKGATATTKGAAITTKGATATTPHLGKPMHYGELSNYRIDRSPRTIVYQKQFEGSSNVYSPNIYYNMEEFAPLNAYDDKYMAY